MTGPYFELSLDSLTVGFFSGFEDQLKWNYKLDELSIMVTHAFEQIYGLNKNISRPVI